MRRLIKAPFADLCKVLEVLCKQQLTCNGAKAVLFATVVEFTGQVVGHGICRPIPEKLASLAHWERPKNITEMRAFLGLCIYHSAHVDMYAEHAALLTRLLQVGRGEGKEGEQEGRSLDPRVKQFWIRHQFSSKSFSKQPM